MCAGRPARVSRSQAAYVKAPIVTQIDGLLTPPNARTCCSLQATLGLRLPELTAKTARRGRRGLPTFPKTTKSSPAWGGD